MMRHKPLTHWGNLIPGFALKMKSSPQPSGRTPGRNHARIIPSAIDTRPQAASSHESALVKAGRLVSYICFRNTQLLKSHLPGRALPESFKIYSPMRDEPSCPPKNLAAFQP